MWAGTGPKGLIKRRDVTSQSRLSFIDSAPRSGHYFQDGRKGLWVRRNSGLGFHPQALAATMTVQRAVMGGSEISPK
ncbi:hypothetical protein DXF93_22875 [Escherichia coli]|nr:hypothetical protein C2U52_01160 [Enterobacteriaceae bacterium ENNIH2]RDT52183.1 hypothetical protein DXF93_22875 [Escherichia coli]